MLRKWNVGQKLIAIALVISIGTVGALYFICFHETASPSELQEETL